MASFDKSYYDILKRYQSINERALYDENGQLVGNLDDNNQFQPATQNPSSASSNDQGFLGGIGSAIKGAASYLNPFKGGPTTYDLAAKNAVAARNAQETGNAGESKSEAAAAPAAAESVPVESKPEAAAAPASPTQEELDLFKKLHGSSYNPNSSMDKAKFAQLQSAGKELGGYKDTERVRNASYAQQYAGKPGGVTYARNAKLAPKTQAVKPASTPGGTPTINVTPSWVAQSKPQSYSDYAQQNNNKSSNTAVASVAPSKANVPANKSVPPNNKGKA